MALKPTHQKVEQHVRLPHLQHHPKVRTVHHQGVRQKPAYTAPCLLPIYFQLANYLLDVQSPSLVVVVIVVVVVVVSQDVEMNCAPSDRTHGGRDSRRPRTKRTLPGHLPPFPHLNPNPSLFRAVSLLHKGIVVLASLLSLLPPPPLLPFLILLQMGPDLLLHPLSSLPTLAKLSSSSRTLALAFSNRPAASSTFLDNIFSVP